MAWRLAGPATDPRLNAAVRGARSLRTFGWMAEECESAALEAVTVREPGSVAEAYLAGRSAALDELRRLTGYRHARQLAFVGFDGDPLVHDRGYDDLEGADAVDRWVQGLRPRDRRIALMLAGGYTKADVAAELGIDRSIVSIAMRRLKAHRRIA